MPPAQRGNIDGVSPRKPNAKNQLAGSSQPGNDQQALDQKPPEKQETKKPVATKPKKSKNLFVIILAVVILIGLSAFAVYTGLRQDSDASDNQTAGQTDSSQNNSTTDNGELIDQTINEIDQLNDQSDTSGEGLSDEKLGL